MLLPEDSDADDTTKANVAFDMFLDPDPTSAASAVEASWEVMVWIARVGAPAPLLGDDWWAVGCYTQELVGGYNL